MHICLEWLSWTLILSGCHGHTSWMVVIDTYLDCLCRHEHTSWMVVMDTHLEWLSWTPILNGRHGSVYPSWMVVSSSTPILNGRHGHLSWVVVMDTHLEWPMSWILVVMDIHLWGPHQKDSSWTLIMDTYRCHGHLSWMSLSWTLILEDVVMDTGCNGHSSLLILIRKTHLGCHCHGHSS